MRREGGHARCVESERRSARGVRPGGAQVAKELVALHNELLRGDTGRLERLRRTAPAAPSASRREQVGPIAWPGGRTAPP